MPMSMSVMMMMVMVVLLQVSKGLTAPIMSIIFPAMMDMGTRRNVLDVPFPHFLALCQFPMNDITRSASK